ncbi:uncharacterized protein B0H18DRAFT_1117523 [Fomitopsis serialis]|uniref:uncharacterized protein n=1 Tax=Fomitopsis serialis TaxID=139415 RepID=UPI002008B4A3|nr:uncharacterized protein B0H18DRAFT_1117523 [Neoantrodia serialis]KAH9929160.1 hypothetical protein B0H18DRAFT_1117523 [Neoantrodia serialis]
MRSIPLPRTPRERPQPIENRGSMLRASILESALELGVGGSGSAVARWMFSPVEEGDEDVDAETEASPSLTYASTATSDDSFLSNTLSPRIQPGAGILLQQVKPPNPAGLVPPSYYASREGLSPINEGVQHIQFDLSASPEPRVVSPIPPTGLGSRFRKLRLNANGDESDGGYISDAGKGKKDKKKKSKKEKGDGNGTEYESDGGYFSEASRTQRKKLKKDKKAAKEKAAESPTTDYETDGGGVGRAKTKKTRSRKASVMSAGTGDDSDGGNVSESSAKKKGFFRRSRKKRDADDSPAQEVPPVPSLPADMKPLPIAGRYLRSPTPNMSELSRIVSDTSQRSSDMSRTTTETSRTMSEFSRATFETSRTATPVINTPDEASLISYASTDPDAGSIIAREGLTKAFGDAKSIHRPSYDVLATFRNQSPTPNQPEDSHGALSPTSHPFGRVFNSPNQSPSNSPSKSKNAKPVISAPNTAMLNAKHVPAPLVLSSPTSVRSQVAQQYTPGSDYIMVTPQATSMPSQTVQHQESEAARPDSDIFLPSPNRRGFNDNGPPSPTTSQSSLRPQVLAYYNIPPPTPPPQGPLPDVPPEPPRAYFAASTELSRTVSADDARARSPFARSPLSASRANPPTRALPLTPVSAPMHSARSASESDARSPSPPEGTLSVPIISEPVPRGQRGRTSPFPTSPVLPARALSPVFSRSESPMTPVSAGPAMSSRAERMGRFIGNKPSSADGYASSSGWRDPARLDVQWAPRSNSALEQRRPDAFDAPPVRKKVSFEDERPSMDEPEDELVYAGERSELHMGDESDMEDETEPVVDDDRSVYPEDDDRSHYGDSRPGTMYSEGEGGDRYSMWSQSDGRRSFFDEDKSAATRDRFVKQVEKMYGEYKVPPVPTLNTRQLKGGVVG